MSHTRRRLKRGDLEQNGRKIYEQLWKDEIWKKIAYTINKSAARNAANVQKRCRKSLLYIHRRNVQNNKHKLMKAPFIWYLAFFCRIIIDRDIILARSWLFPPSFQETSFSAVFWQFTQKLRFNVRNTLKSSERLLNYLSFGIINFALRWNVNETKSPVTVAPALSIVIIIDLDLSGKPDNKQLSNPLISDFKFDVI